MKKSGLPRYLFALIILSFIFLSSGIRANCDCGSVDSSKPCLSNSLSVEIPNLEQSGAKDLKVEWRFASKNKDVACGTFANGDYWVAPVTPGASIDLLSVKTDDNSKLYVDADPNVELIGFLDKNYGNLNSSENLYKNLPTSFSKPTSLVAVIQRDEKALG